MSYISLFAAAPMMLRQRVDPPTDQRGKIYNGWMTPIERQRLPDDVLYNVTLSITASASLAGAEIRIYDLDNLPAGSLGTELAGIESCLGAGFNASIGVFNTVFVQIMLDGFEEFGQQVYMDANKSFYALLKRELNT